MSFDDDASHTLTSAATVTVTADTTPPEVVSAGVVTSGDTETLDQTNTAILTLRLHLSGRRARPSLSATPPTITGTAQVGQTLTAVTTGITDADGLTSPTYTYQWIRVNGTEADIAGENSSTYTLDDADLGKTIKVKVSFDDDASNTETLTSAATVTVTAAASTNTAPMAADKTVTTGEDRAYAFTADDFGFDDADAGATLASVTIVTAAGGGHAGARRHGGHGGRRRHQGPDRR